MAVASGMIFCNERLHRAHPTQSGSACCGQPAPWPCHAHSADPAPEHLFCLPHQRHGRVVPKVVVVVEVFIAQGQSSNALT